MDFEFTEAQREFARQVDAFIEENRADDVMDPTRENFAQLVDTPPRRAFMQKIGERGWLGMTWPKEYGGADGEGIYEYLLNERLAAVGAPQIGKGVGIIGKTLIRHGSDKLKREFLPKILNNEIEFAIGYSEPQAGSDAAAMALRATRDGDGWRLNGQKIFTTSAHFAQWYWVGARTDPEAPKHSGISLFLLPMDAPGLTVQSMPTIGNDITNQVFFDDVYVGDDYLVGELNRGFQYISEALDLERFTMFTFSPIQKRVELLCNYVAAEERDGRPLREDPVVRQRIARLVTETEVARVLGLSFVAASMKGGKPPTCEASAYKLYATELSQRVANAALDIAGPGGQLRVGTQDAPMKGRSDSAYRATVVETIGGGSSEIQKNILARRKLGLPKNF
ncbi:MAG: acyl-CoA dehydrogenase family protein [Deltaproteobacteria bacterium]|nr:MAG: acyl-CoA dehydrogenase family protein [Deltaproteobacteria bacterium]